MMLWFLLAFGAAIANSFVQVAQKWAVFLSRYSKLAIVCIASASASILLFAISYLVIGPPEIDSRFWLAVLISGVLNGIALPVLLKAYEMGEFSAVYSMILLTPVFLLLTAFILLGERPAPVGILGVFLTVFGLLIITRTNHEHTAVADFAKGNWLGIIVALIWSVTVNFDKLAARYSDVFFAPAVNMAVVAAVSLIFLLVRRSRVPSKSNGRILTPGAAMVLLLGGVMVFSNILHNAALLAGPASYTIAIKRMGVLFGVFWGWLLFKEKGISKKFLGAAIAVSGAAAILFSLNG